MNKRVKRRLAKISNELVGKTINEARDIFPSVRPIMIDGVHTMVTQDIRIDRINVEVENNQITKVLGVY